MSKKDDPDRKRLEAEVHQTELKEGNINEDFLDSIKQYGPWIAVAVLAVIAVRLWMVRQVQADTAHRDGAWYELLTTTEPESLNEIAVAYADVDAVSDLARLQAGEIHLSRLTADETLSVESRQAALDGARSAFELVLLNDDGSRAGTVIAVTALNGLASIAEAKGDLDEARAFYGRAADRAQGWLEPLALQARARAEDVAAAAAPIERPKAAPRSVPAIRTPAFRPIESTIDNPLGLPIDPPASLDAPASGDSPKQP
jgi:hypothetical protein